MEYNFQIQLNFEQLLHLVLQLPKVEQQHLISALLGDNPTAQDAWMPALRMKTVAQILAEDYQYPAKNPNSLVGAWEGEESVETILALHTQ